MSESRDREGDEQKTNNQAYEVDERVGLPNTREEYGAQELNQTSADSHRTPHSDVVLPQASEEALDKGGCEQNSTQVATRRTRVLSEDHCTCKQRNDAPETHSADKGHRVIFQMSSGICSKYMQATQ